MRDYGHGGDVYGNLGVRLDFSVNTNPLGMPDSVRSELASRVDEFSLYPDPNCRTLRSAIAAAEGVPEDYVLCGNGAADLIYRLCHTLKPETAVVCAPTFSEYERALAQVGCRVMRHALSPDDNFALSGGIVPLFASGVDLVFLCHPNNPTGRLIPPDLIEQIVLAAQRNRVRVVIDECFLDFTDGRSFKEYLCDTPELIVVKAFTKTYALAGLRLGYLLTSDAEILERADAVSQCWSVSVPAQIAGVAALGCPDWLAQTRGLVKSERLFLFEKLTLMGFDAVPGEANYLLLRSKIPLYEPLLRHGILVRQCGNFRGLDASYYRIAVKTRAENLILLNAIKEIVNG